MSFKTFTPQTPTSTPTTNSEAVSNGFIPCLNSNSANLLHKLEGTKLFRLIPQVEGGDVYPVLALNTLQVRFRTPEGMLKDGAIPVSLVIPNAVVDNKGRLQDKVVREEAWFRDIQRLMFSDAWKSRIQSKDNPDPEGINFRTKQRVLTLAADVTDPNQPRLGLLNMPGTNYKTARVGVGSLIFRDYIYDYDPEVGRTLKFTTSGTGVKKEYSITVPNPREAAQIKLDDTFIGKLGENVEFPSLSSFVAWADRDTVLGYLKGINEVERTDTNRTYLPKDFLTVVLKEVFGIADNNQPF